MKKFLFILAALYLFGCQKEENTSIALHFNLPDFPVEDLILENIEEGILDTVSLKGAEHPSWVLDKASKPFVLAIQEAGRYKFHYVYVQPGETLNLKSEAGEEPVIRIDGMQGPANEYLSEYDRLNKEAGLRSDLFALCKLPADSFKLQLTERTQPLAGLIDRIAADANLDPALKQALRNRLAAARATAHLNYPNYYRYQHKEEAILPDNFNEAFKEVTLDESLLVFEVGRSFGIQFNNKSLANWEPTPDENRFSAQLKQVVKTFENPVLQHYFQLRALENQINFGTGVDGVQAELAAYRADNPGAYMLEKLETTLRPWLGLKSGNQAPDFSAMDRNGEMVQLSQLKGKSVYIDVWATWCNPCIAQIPALKELEEELHDQAVAFVSVSIDEEKNREKWLAFIEKENLGGTQLLAEGAWKSEVAKAYNILGIPRFLLIDAEGKIVSANAPRPSNPETSDMIRSSIINL